MVNKTPSTNSDTELLQTYVKIGSFLAKAFAPHLEVGVMDYRKGARKVISVFNGNITGRQVGDAITDIGYLRIAGKITEDESIGYPNKGKTGQPVRSSAMAIRNNKGELIGVMGIHYDLTHFDQFARVLDMFMAVKKPDNFPEYESFSSEYNEKSSTSIQEIVSAVLLKKNWHVSRMTQKEKVEAIKLLHDAGVFQKRRSAVTVATELDISKPTLYKYLARLSPGHGL